MYENIPGGGGVSAVKWSSMLEHENSERPILCGFSSWVYPHSTHFRTTPHSFSVNGVTDKTPFHTFLEFLANIVAVYRLFVQEKPPFH